MATPIQRQPVSKLTPREYKKKVPPGEPTSEEQLRAVTVGELQPLTERLHLAEYDRSWPVVFVREQARIHLALGPRALRIDHVGSTSVPGLAAKPIIDILLVVVASADEDAYVPRLIDCGYTLRIREPEWYEHRMLKKTDPAVHLHVFSAGCPEIDRMLVFRDWLRHHDDDRARYERAKRELIDRDWKYMQNYADAKTAVVEEIMARAQPSAGQRVPGAPA